MGNLTANQIITQGLAIVSRPDLADLALIDLNAWLEKRAEDWPWPKLHRRKEGVSLPSGSRSISFGAGSSGVTLQVQRIIDPIWIYKSDYTGGAKLRIRTITDGNEEWDETINNPTTRRAKPEVAKVKVDETTEGKWTIVPMQVPDKNYLLAVDYIVMPAPVVGTTIPWYSGDSTMIKVVEVFSLNYTKRYDVLAQEREVLRNMVVEDRMRKGQIEGTNATLGLDSSIFR